MELAVLVAFCVILVINNVLGLPLLCGLLAGLVLFWAFALVKRFSIRNVARMSFSGVKTVKGVITVFLCIGVLTGLWRASGTISALVTLTGVWCNPSVWPALSFLSCCAVSFLMGTAFGTCATMGVVCMAIAHALGVDAAQVGGAILAGCYFGDRCSPVSSSALLVGELTNTKVIENISAMLKHAILPFAVSVALYIVLGCIGASGGQTTAETYTTAIMAGFTWHFVVFLPAILVLVLAAFKCSAKLTLLASAAVAFFVALLVQGDSVVDLLRILALGFVPTGEQSTLLSGGGIKSMITPICVVLLASTYTGIFRETGLLSGVLGKLERVARRSSSFGACASASVLTSLIAFNQTFAIILANELYAPIQAEGKERFHDLVDSASVIAPLVPWSIAATVPLTLTGAPNTSLLFAFFLFLLPLWRLLVSLWK